MSRNLQSIPRIIKRMVYIRLQEWNVIPIDAISALNFPICVDVVSMSYNIPFISYFRINSNNTDIQGIFNYSLLSH